MNKKKITKKDVIALKALVNEAHSVGKPMKEAIKTVGTKLGMTAHQVHYYYYRKRNVKHRKVVKRTVIQKVEKVKSQHIIPLNIIDNISITQNSVIVTYK